MTRGAIALGLTAVLAGIGAGCFSDAKQVCDAGSEGCACIELQCEAGLECVGAVCTSMSGTDSGTGETGAMTTSTTDPSTSGTSTTTDPDTTAGTTGSSTGGDTTGSDTTGSVELCGNGELDPDEECDAGPGCTDCELDNYNCNPLTNAPCEEGFKCSYVYEPPYFSCLVFSSDPPAPHGDNECFYNGDAHDEWCDVGLGCSLGNGTATCEDGGCCVEYCDLLDDRFTCITKGDECVAALGPASPEGLSYLGWCVTP